MLYKLKQKQNEDSLLVTDKEDDGIDYIVYIHKEIVAKMAYCVVREHVMGR